MDGATANQLAMIVSKHTRTSTRSTSNENYLNCNYPICTPSCCQRFRNIRITLVCLCWCGFMQNVCTNGVVNSVITTLERRYDLASKESGAIASTYDIGGMLVLIPVTYIGAKMRKTRVVSIGMILISLGSFLFYLCHLSSGYYEKLQKQELPLCSPIKPSNMTALTCGASKTNKLNNYKYAFWLAHFLVGIGTSSLYTLGLVYLDENLSAHATSFYLSIYYTICLFGPALGFIMASSTLKIYVDYLHKQVTLTPENSGSWVGAWWINFLVISILILVPVIPLYGFPKEMPNAHKIRAERKDDTYGKSEEIANKIDSTVSPKNLFLNMIALFRNPTFMFISFCGAMEAQVLTGFSTFGAKFIQEIFYKDAGTASRLMGVTLIPSGTSGVFASGLVIRYFKLTTKGILRLQFIMTLVTVPTYLGFYLTCGSSTQDLGFAGVTTPYNGVGSLSGINLTAACNAQCNCNPDGNLMSKVCGSNSLTYYSPCHAGCTTVYKNGYGNCSCVPSNATDVLVGNVQPAKCGSECSHLIWFLVLFGINIFCVLFVSVPATAVTLRSVPVKQRSLAMGLQWLIIRIFGSIIGPIIFGSVFDRSCLMWTKRCGIASDCGYYDTKGIRVGITTCGIIFKSLSALCVFLALWFHRHDGDE